MSMLNFWILFAYINVVAILLFHTFKPALDDLQEEMDEENYLEDKTGLVDAMLNKTRIKPDQYGVIGELRDADGTTFYAILINQEQMNHIIALKDQGEKADANHANADTKGGN